MGIEHGHRRWGVDGGVVFFAVLGVDRRNVHRPREQRDDDGHDQQEHAGTAVSAATDAPTGQPRRVDQPSDVARCPAGGIDAGPFMPVRVLDGLEQLTPRVVESGAAPPRCQSGRRSEHEFFGFGRVVGVSPGGIPQVGFGVSHDVGECIEVGAGVHCGLFRVRLTSHRG